jgi:hypothetical protein
LPELVLESKIFFPHLEIKFIRRSSSRTSKSNSLEVLHPHTLEADSRVLFKQDYSTHAKRESAVPSIPDAQEAHHRAFPHANVHPKAHPHPTHPRQMHTAALSLLASE